MASATTITDPLDRGDPWGFGDAGRFVAVAVPPWPGAALAPTPVSAVPPWATVEPGTLAGVDAPRQLETARVAPGAAAAPVSRPASAREPWTLRLSITPQRVGLLSLFAAVVAALGFYLGLTLTGVAAALPATGEVVLSSHPAGAQVTVDGRAAGVTPLVLALPAGRRTVAVARPDAGSETLLLDVRAGERLTRHVPLATVRANAQHVDTGAVPAGVSLVVAAPAPPAAAGPVSGWVRVHAPFDVEVFEGGRLLGTSGAGRLRLAEGRHELELANPSLGYRATLTATVAAGRTLTLTPAMPRAAVHVNASPWAEVFADGLSLGETPLANVPLPLGDQTLVFRHPDLGERTARVTVRASGGNRVAVAFTR